MASTDPRVPSTRAAALDVWRRVLEAADPAPLVRRALRLEAGRLVAGRFTLDLSDVASVIVLGCGKASAAMAAAAEDVLGDRIAGGFVVVKDGCVEPTRRVRIVEAGHPVPDARGVEAASTLLELALRATERDVVVFLVSGGGSALTPAPAAPISLAEKQQMTRALLRAGATIQELNAVRKHLSLFKGGQLARAAWPATVVTLALSDVIGDPLDVIASGPTAPDPTTFADALAIIDRRGLRADIPGSILERLSAGARGEIPETPKPGDPVFERVSNVIVGNNALVTDTAVARATRLGFRTECATREISGEARDVAGDLLKRARALTPPACLVAGGETTVTVRGRGQGGRCQEFALAAALAIDGATDVVVLAAGTDGTDGPTDAAGALVDGATISRATAGGVDAVAALRENDSYRALAASGDLVRSGPTRTNLLDLYAIFRV